MTIITRKKQAEIAKRLAAIYYTAVIWQDEDWVDFLKCIVDNCAEIAYAVGGERMASIEVPALVEQLNRQSEQGEKK